MKHLRTIIVSVMLCATTAMYGVSSFIELSVGGGWSTLAYGLSNKTQPNLSMRQTGSYGLNGHIGYGLQFTRMIGAGVGVDIARYGATALMSGEAQWLGVTDSEGELYNHFITVHRWADRQQLWMIEIPISLYLRFPVGQDARLYGQIGVKPCIPVIAKAEYSGSLTHRGEYTPWGMTLNDVPNHGFYSSEPESTYALKTQLTVAAFVKLGIEAPVDNNHNIWLYGAIGGTFHFMSAIPMQETATPIGWRNDTSDEANRQAHAFMNDYSSVLATEIVTGKALPIAVGAEIGVRFRIPHARIERCRCDTD